MPDSDPWVLGCVCTALAGMGSGSLPTPSCLTGYHHLCLHSESNMPLTMPALFVFLEMKDYVPGAWAGRSPWHARSPRVSVPPSFPSSQPPEWGEIQMGHPGVGEDRGGFQAHLHIHHVVMSCAPTQISLWPSPTPSSSSVPMTRGL